MITIVTNLMYLYKKSSFSVLQLGGQYELIILITKLMDAILQFIYIFKFIQIERFHYKWSFSQFDN